MQTHSVDMTSKMMTDDNFKLFSVKQSGQNHSID